MSLSGVSPFTPPPIYHIPDSAPIEQPIVEMAILEDTKKQWLQKGKGLSPAGRDEFARYIQAAAQRIFSTLSMMSALNYPADKIQSEARRAISTLNLTSGKFFTECQSYEQQKGRVTQELDSFKSRIQTTSINFTPFSPIVTPPPAHRDAEGHDSSHAEDLRDWFAGKLNRRLELTRGRPTAAAVDAISNVLTAGIPPGSQNPIRDRIISGGVSIGIGEAIQYFLPGRLQAYTVITGVNLLGRAAQSAQASVNNFRNNSEVEYWWNRQWELTGEGSSYASSCALASGMLTLAQVPRDVLHTVHHYVTLTAAYISDTVGLTEENIAFAARRSLEFIAQNSPELMEERTWARAAADIEARRNRTIQGNN